MSSQVEIKDKYFHLEVFLKGVFFTNFVKLLELPIRHFHSEYRDTFSNDAQEKIYQKLDAVTSCRETIGYLQFVEGELLDEAHYSKVKTQFSSEFLKKLPRNSYRLKSIYWYNFLPMAGYLTHKEREELNNNNPSSLINFGNGVPKISFSNGKDLNSKIKILVTEDDFDEDDVEDLKSAYSLIIEGASEIRNSSPFSNHLSQEDLKYLTENFDVDDPFN